MVAATRSVRGEIVNINGESHGIQGTLKELNRLISCAGKARFVVDDGTVWIEFPSANGCRVWSHVMNIYIFPNQRGVCGKADDSATVECGFFFRFPEEFYHLCMYIGEDKIAFSNSQWVVADEGWANKVGHFEEGYGREAFAAWMQRQISRLHPARVVQE